jgi:hypothetical protein
MGRQESGYESRSQLRELSDPAPCKIALKGTQVTGIAANTRPSQPALVSKVIWKVRRDGGEWPGTAPNRSHVTRYHQSQQLLHWNTELRSACLELVPVSGPTLLPHPRRDERGHLLRERAPVSRPVCLCEAVELDQYRNAPTCPGA